MTRFWCAVLAALCGVVSVSAEPVFRAEVSGPRAVWVITPEGLPSLEASAYHLTTASGDEIPVAEVVASTAQRTLIVPARDLDISRVHYIRHGDKRTRVRFDGWFRNLYSAKPLGAEVAADGRHTDIRLFAPRASAVTLVLYPGRTGPADREIHMSRDAAGVWEARLDGDLSGIWYDFEVYGPEDPGNRFFGQAAARITDPYARVSDDSFGRAMIARPTRPAPALAGGRPAMEDVIAYEVHVQDFTDLLPVDVRDRGALSGMTVAGLTNARGTPVGFDHLKSLGVNVVHLMPVQEYLHYPDAEWQAAFASDKTMQRLGIADENYQWGYRTTHAMAVETRFRRQGSAPGDERTQFRDLVAAFHEAGMAVIIDIVPNHTGENMDGRDFAFNFNAIDKYYYYRTDDNGAHIGPYGNEVKTEDRPMVQRWIIDQARHWVEEFGIDGFRIDLAGQIDEQTLRKLKVALPEDILIYGEPWIDVTDPYVRANPDWDWYKADSPITFFQDDARNAFKGSPFQLEDPRRDNGFAGGNGALRADAMRALENRYPEEAGSPNQGLNYLDIHDNWALADRFASQDFDGRTGVDATRMMIAATLLMSSQGPVVLHGGTEILRTKGLAARAEFERHTASGPLYFKGRDDTYNQRAPNRFLWNTVGATAADGPLDVQGMTDFWRGLIKLRLSDQGSVFRRATPVSEGHYHWILPDDPHALGYVVGERIMVLVNTGNAAVSFDAALPRGRWRQIATHAGFTGAESPAMDSTAVPREAFTLVGPGLSIWRRD